MLQVLLPLLIIIIKQKQVFPNEQQFVTNSNQILYLEVCSCLLSLTLVFLQGDPVLLKQDKLLLLACEGPTLTSSLQGQLSCIPACRPSGTPSKSCCSGYERSILQAVGLQCFSVSKLNIRVEMGLGVPSHISHK